MNVPEKTYLWRTKNWIALAALLSAWFGAAYFIGVEQLLVNTKGEFMAPIAVSAVLPVVIFLALYALWPRFRGFVLAQDIATLTALQHWRMMGFGFLPLYAHGVLPGLCAWPAGLGDVAIGIAAAFIVARLRRDPEFVLSPAFRRFNLLGLLDFAAAIATAGLTAGQFPGLIANGVTSAAMDIWPLNIFPSFAVPIFIIRAMHLTQAARFVVSGSWQSIRAQCWSSAIGLRTMRRAGTISPSCGGRRGSAARSAASGIIGSLRGACVTAGAAVGRPR